MKYKLSTLNSQLSTLLFAVLFAAPLRGQVIIGSSANPKAFSLLEIDATNNKGGLLLPQLTDGVRDGLVSGGSASGDKMAAEGLFIYNAGNDCLQFWNGENWISICSDSSIGQPLDACTVAPAQPGVITGSKAVSSKSTSGVIYSISPVAGATSYTWTVPAGWTLPGGGATLTTANLSITAFHGAGASGGNITVRANNDCGNSAVSILAVTIFDGCGAFISRNPDVWKEFMCYNLGVIGNPDPFEPSEEVNGDYYKWGDPTAAAGPEAGQPDDWSSDEPDGYYGSGVEEEVTTDKSGDDPCPPGFRIPNKDEWEGVIKNNSKMNKIAAGSTWSYDSDENWTGAMFGDALFLPTAGSRNKRDGLLANRGANGYYWSSTLDVYSTVYELDFDDKNLGVYDSSSRTNGRSIRCIVE